MVLTDILKRWNQLQGRKALLLTGTDEHGMKVQQAAAAAGTEPRKFCDSGANTFQVINPSFLHTGGVYGFSLGAVTGEPGYVQL
jgi:methionyl-tRNA synthetase